MARPVLKGLRFALLWVAVVMVVTLTLGSSLPGPEHLPAVSTSSGATGGTVKVSSAVGHVPIAFPPVRVHRLTMLGPASVDPTGGYSSEPAPMGIGDFGVGAGDASYSYSTSEFLGNFSWQSMSFDNGGDTYFSDQLNVVLQFTQDGVTYAYWIQDVAFMDSSSRLLEFENNIWNMTTGQSCLDNTAVSGNGTVYSTENSEDPCQGYYAVSPAPSLPGSTRTMGPTGDFGLLVRAYQTSGVPEVAFEYWDGVTSYYVTYDNVVWPWATAVSSDNNFLVDGAEYNPGGWFYDAELAIGGPGGGSSTESLNPTHITSQLLYWNGHNFEAPPSVWNFGANTAETVSNVQSIFSNNAAGLPLTVQLNGTARNASPDQAYAQHQVGTLAITASGISSGTVAIPGDSWPFVDDQATLTLVPGIYQVWVNSTMGPNDLGACAVTAGGTTTAVVGTGCSPVVSTPTASPTSDDLGQSVTFDSSLESAGSGGDTYLWQTTPTGLGCTGSTTLTLSCTPVSTGSYKVNLTVTDSIGAKSTTPNLGFTVYSDPSAGTPSPSRSSTEVGAPVTFTASPTGGSGGYSYSWSGLPTPCTGTGTSEASCTPSAVGNYSVVVKVTDSNHESSTGSALSFVVSAGPSVAAPVASPSSSIDLGQEVSFSVAASGGSGDYSYSWSGLPSGCVSASSENVTCTPDSVGSSNVSVSVTDEDGGTATSAALSFVVDSDPSVGALAGEPASADLGQTLRFVSSGASGGAGSYHYVWSGLPAGCASVDLPTLSCLPNGTGSGRLVLTVFDANDGNASTSASYTVFSDPVLSAVAASRAGADVGEAVEFTASGVAGGTGTYTYRWSDLPTGCASVDSSSLSCQPTAAGSSDVTLTVTDSNGMSVNRSLSFVVDSAPVVRGPIASAASVAAGSSVTFSANVSGGSGDDRFSWAGLPSGCPASNSSTLTCAPSTAGTFNVSLTVTDSNGVSAHGTNLTFRVTSSASTALGLSPLEEYGILAAIFVAVVAAIALAVRRSRRRRPALATTSATGGP